jgi:Acetyltransferase (GNAT) domain
MARILATEAASSGPGTLTFRPLAQAPNIWREAVASCPRATLYHSPEWLELLHRAYKLSFELAILARNGQVQAACIFARSRNPLARQLVSLRFSDCCVPLATDDEAAHRLLDMIAGDGAGANRWEVRGFPARAPWETVACFQNWELDLARSFTAVEREAHGNFRRAAKRARNAGIRVERGSDMGLMWRFYSMHRETRRRLGVPVQPSRFFDLSREIFAPRDAFEVWLAVDGGRDAAGLILLRHRNRLYYKWSARPVDGSLNANHLLLWSIIEEFSGRAKVLDCGRTDRRNEGLVRFKRHLGARPVALPYSYFPKAPKNVSAEMPAGMQKLAAHVWRRLPLTLTGVLSSALYRLLS